MRICDKHWDRFIDSLPASLLPLVHIIVSEEMLIFKDKGGLENDIKNFAFAMQYNNNPKELQKEIEKHGGCPICYLGEEFFERVMKRLELEESVESF